MPASRSANIRQKPGDTPPHPGGLSADASRRLDEYRKARGEQRNDGITACKEVRPDAPRGLGDFQKRLNRDGRNNGRGQQRPWNATPFHDGVFSSRGPKGTWEEEQTKLDRVWYMMGEEGGVVSGYLVRYACLLTLNRWQEKNTTRLPSGKTSKSSSKLKLLQSRWFVPLCIF